MKTYERHIPAEIRQVSKYKMQKIERKHLTLRTRVKRAECTVLRQLGFKIRVTHGLARQTICFSKSIEMHDIAIGLFINRYEFGLDI